VRRIRLAIASVPILLSLALLGRMAMTRRPIIDGTSAEFWEAACGVQLGGFPGYRGYAHYGDIYPTVDGWLYYFTQEHHQQPLHRLAAYDAARDVREVIVRLRSDRPSCDPREAASLDDARLCELHEQGARKRSLCRAVFDEASLANEPVPAIITRLRVVSLPAADAFELSGRAAEAEVQLRKRLRQADRAWLTDLFEAAFLASWWLFVAWPWVRRASFRTWLIHVVTAPLLLFIPFFLGYAPMTFTFGPSGGVLYPLYLALAALPMSVVPCSGLDVAIWRRLPMVLAPLNQLPGAPLAWSNSACVGPLSSLAFGVLLGALMSGGRLALQLGRRAMVRVRP
jgi:hypothetical protein